MVEVLVRLSPEEDKSDQAMVLLERMILAVRDEERGVWKFKFPEAWTWLISNLLEEWLEVAPSIFARPWWVRAWMLQEFVVSQKSPLFFCGNKCVSSAGGDRLLSSPDLVESPQFGSGFKNFRRRVAESLFGLWVFDMTHARKEWPENGSIKIEDLLRESQQDKQRILEIGSLLMLA